MAGIAALGTSLSALASGPGGVTNIDLDAHPEKPRVFTPDPSIEGNGTRAPHGSSVGLRNVDSCTAGGSQLGYRNDGNPPGARNAISATVVDDFHPTTNAAPTKIGWSAHFRGGSGSFSIPYRDATGPEVTLVGATEPFTVTIYNTNPVTNVPDFTSPVFSQVFPSVTRTLDTTPVGGPITSVGKIKMFGYVGQPQANWPEFQIYNYCVTLMGAPALDNTKCYWLGIRRNGSMPDDLGGSTGAGWRWMNSAPFPGVGNNYCYQKFDADPNFSFWSTVDNLDCCFSMDVPFNLNVCPANPLTGSCALPELDGSAGNTNCQSPGVTDTGSTIIIRSNKAIATAAEVLTCDNVTTTAPNTLLTGLCFTGVYGGLSNNLRPAPDQAFTIRVFKNNLAGFYGYPDVNQQVLPTVTVKPSGHADPDRNSTNTAVVGPGAPTMDTFKTFLPFGGIFDHTVDLTGMTGGGILLPTAGCYWIGIEGQAGSVTPSVNTPFSFVLKPWHSVVSGTEGDGYLCAHSFALGANFSAADINTGFDSGMCMSFTLSSNLLTCPGVQPTSNKDCANAENLSAAPHSAGPGLPVPPFVGSTLNTQNTGATGNPPAFGSVTATDFAAGVWYKYTMGGTDRRVTVSMCSTGNTAPAGEPTTTQFDTLLTVYCNTCGSLKAVGDNDDAPVADCPGVNTPDTNTTIGASRLTFSGKANTQYYIYLAGSNGNSFSQGFFWMDVGTAAADAERPAIDCAAIIDPPCTMTFPPADANNIYEGNFCASPLSDGNSSPCLTQGSLVQQVGPNKFGHGTVSTPDDGQGLGRDEDWWEITPQAGLPPANNGDSQNIVRVTFTSEVPLTMAMFTSPSPFCPLDPNLTGTAVLIPPCNQDFFDFHSLDSGKNFFRVRPTNITGLPCGTRNKYTFKVTTPGGGEFGACCVFTTPDCILTTRDACTDSQAGIIGVFVGGACAPEPCDVDAANGGGIGASLNPFGACCQPDGACTVTTSAGCPQTNGATWTVVYTRPATCPESPTGTPPCPYPAGTDISTVCTPYPCSGQNLRRCCFNDGSCRFVSALYCANVLMGTSSAGVCLPRTCQQVFFGACCRGNSVCTIETQTACTGTNSGQYKGDNTVCTPTNPCTGLCCAGTLCVINLKAACTALQATSKYTLGGTGPCPGTNTSPCCKANFNHVGTITVQDLFDFLAAWFGGSQLSNINGAGVTVQDLFDFLAAWFGGGCV